MAFNPFSKRPKRPKSCLLCGNDAVELARFLHPLRHTSIARDVIGPIVTMTGWTQEHEELIGLGCFPMLQIFGKNLPPEVGGESGFEEVQPPETNKGQSTSNIDTVNMIEPIELVIERSDWRPDIVEPTRLEMYFGLLNNEQDPEKTFKGRLESTEFDCAIVALNFGPDLSLRSTMGGDADDMISRLNDLAEHLTRHSSLGGRMIFAISGLEYPLAVAIENARSGVEDPRLNICFDDETRRVMDDLMTNILSESRLMQTIKNSLATRSLVMSACAVSYFGAIGFDFEMNFGFGMTKEKVGDIYLGPKRYWDPEANAMKSTSVAGFLQDKNKIQMPPRSDRDWQPVGITDALLAATGLAANASDEWRWA